MILIDAWLHTLCTFTHTHPLHIYTHTHFAHLHTHALCTFTNTHTLHIYKHSHLNTKAQLYYCRKLLYFLSKMVIFFYAIFLMNILIISVIFWQPILFISYWIMYHAGKKAFTNNSLFHTTWTTTITHSNKITKIKNFKQCK